jgi:hypothetical protein
MKFLDNHHIVRGWVGANITGAGATSDIVSLKNYNHCTIILDFGATDLAADVDITVYACDDVAASHSAAINNFTFRKSAATTADDSFSTATTITDSKLDYVLAGDVVPNDCDNSIVVIDVPASLVRAASTTYEMDCVKIAFPNPGQNCTVGCLFILSEPRHAAATMPSAIAD